MLKPVGLIHGHYECRFLEETLPIFSDLLALEIVERKEGQAILKHPNTDWLLIVHEGGPNARNKPHNNHYGFRVANHGEIEAAYEYHNWWEAVATKDGASATAKAAPSEQASA